MSDIEVGGVTVHRRDDESGPTWGWQTRERYGIVMHHEIQWRKEDYRWLRAAAISETAPDVDGGWQRYPVHLAKAYSEEEAWDVVRKQLERELANKPEMP